MSAIPAAYRRIIDPLIVAARGNLEKGESLVPVAFVGNFATGTVIPVMLDSRSEEAKEHSAMVIAQIAEQYDADFIFVLMEAWSLRKDKLARADEIRERYGSIGASPYAIDTVVMSLETRRGVWMAEIPVKPKGHSKKKRTIPEPEFRLYTEVAGRFVDLLPEREKAEGAGETLH